MQPLPFPSASPETRPGVQYAIRPPANPPLDAQAVLRGLDALDRVVGR
jgi:hypothetical protein